jgi:hypothetical protein
METLKDIITGNPILLLFIVLSIGFVIGSLKIGSFQLGSVAGVLLSGLLFGHLGYKSLPTIETLGFVIFIFSVGYSAGPRFIQALKKDGRRYIAIALIVSISGKLLYTKWPNNNPESRTPATDPNWKLPILRLPITNPIESTINKRRIGFPVIISLNVSILIILIADKFKELFIQILFLAITLKWYSFEFNSDKLL